MSNVQWTSEQLQAINEKGSNILVAAAAGSGKTAVLVERIIHKILEENVNIDELLVVTFTNAAASEMRQRVLDAIYEYLEEHPEDTRMQEQIVRMAKANICTIHSFCLDVIRNHFYEIGISPNIRVGQQSEMELLKRQVLEDLFEEKYEKEDEEFLLLIDTYTNYRGDENLKELLLKIIRNISSNPFPEEWLRNAVEEFHITDLKRDFASTKWGQILLQEFKEELQMCLLELEEIKKELDKFYELDKFSKTIASDISLLEEVNCNLDSWDKVVEIANTMKWETWPRDSKIDILTKELAKEKRDQVKKKWNKIKDKFFTCSSEQINQDMSDMYKKLLAISNLIFEFNEKFAKEKLEKNVMDFHDIEHFALKILVKTNESGQKVPTEIALEYREKFKEIAIDEYQDSNLIQEYILNMISNENNIFMVGDVKQSIYKFRQARPELFLEKYETYQLKNQKQEKDSLKIQLFKNFRSRKNVLDVTNLVFETIMSKDLGDITYNEEEYLNLGADYPEPDIKTSINIIDLKRNEEDEDELEQIEDAVLEARFVANQIEELVKSKYQVYDRKKGYRDISYKDIVILLRSTSNLAPIYEKELNSKDIPVFSDTGRGYFDSIEIQTMISLLKIIDNPMQDIPLVSVLRSPIGGFDDNELIQIKLNGKNEKNEYFYDTFVNALESENMPLNLKEKMQKFLQNIDNWREQNEYKPLDEFIWQIYLDTGYYHYAGLMPNGSLRQANLKMLFERAREYEKASFKGLFNFINYINQLKMTNNDMDSAKIIGENEDVVRIMSIHKSKGLEFPVVILSSTAKKFNLQDLNETVLLHQDLGIGTKYIDEKRKIEYPTLAKTAIGETITKETLSEEMRILYVALTRAKEKLIITGISKDFEKDIKKKKEKLEIVKAEKINPNIIKQYKSYLDWLLLVYLKDEKKAKTIIELNMYDKKQLQERLETTKVQENTTHFIEECKKYDIKENLKKQLEWEYPYKASCNIPTMTSVSKIKELEMQNDLPDLLTLVDKEGKTKEVEKKVPEFLKEETKVSKARIGTLVHLCLQKLNEREEYNLEKIKNLINTLVQKQLVTQKESQMINPNDILLYTKSDLFADLKTAKEVHKETPFYFDMEAREIVKEEVDEKILVQGIIDLYYIDKNDNMILVDYKTDFVKQEEELIVKYKKQLEIYKGALEEATGHKVDNVYIYSICLQKTITV
ncbi:MAG: helicase-exonuclease AddAB subunit AddA [Clostridia bacterium]|nr:helicase-exonuclease AddAB subunit AddA [Clostridia bacterium]